MISVIIGTRWGKQSKKRDGGSGSSSHAFFDMLLIVSRTSSSVIGSKEERGVAWGEKGGSGGEGFDEDVSSCLRRFSIFALKKEEKIDGSSSLSREVGSGVSLVEPRRSFKVL